MQALSHFQSQQAAWLMTQPRSERRQLGTSPRADLQLPQNLASAAFSNPHLHFMDRHLSSQNYQRAVTIIFVIQALNSRMTGTAGAAPASEMFPMREHPA